MKKSDLEIGMKVVLNNGLSYVVVNKDKMANPDRLINESPGSGGWMDLNSYDENLNIRRGNDEWNVAKIYKFNRCFWEEYPKKVQKKLEFSFDSSNCWVIYEGNKTTVLLSNGVQASTTCLPEDTYSEEKGKEIAVRKAIIKQLSKELKELTK